MDRSHADLDAFDLRLRELEIPDSSADIAAFARPLQAVTGGLDDEDEARLLLESAALAEGLVALPRGRDDALIPLFGEALSRPIPAPAAASEAAIIDAAPWDIPRARAFTVAVAPRGGAPLRAVMVAAVTVPLIATTPALAAEPAVQRPKTEVGASVEAPTLPPEPSYEVPLEPVAPPEPEPIGAPGPTAAAIDLDAPPTAEGGFGGVPEGHWQAMKGEDVKLMLAGGARSGRLVEVDGPDVVFVDYDDRGRLLSVPKSAVMELRGVIRQAAAQPGFGMPDPRLPTGNGLLAGGIVAMSIGTPFFLSGIGIAFACGIGSCTSITVPLALPGLLLAGGGIAMTVIGAKRKKAWRESAYRTSRIRPSFSGSAQAWTGALTLRF